MTVDLGKPMAIGLVAARTAAQNASVSNDGTQWVALTRRPAIASWPAALWDVDGSWRFVRVEGTQQGSLQLAEISVWPHGPAAVPASAAPPSNSPTAPSHHHHSRGVPAWLLVVAVALVAIVVAAGSRLKRSR